MCSVRKPGERSSHVTAQVDLRKLGLAPTLLMLCDTYIVVLNASGLENNPKAVPTNFQVLEQCPGSKQIKPLESADIPSSFRDDSLEGTSQTQ